jgi:hypothetical protein
MEKSKPKDAFRMSSKRFHLVYAQSDMLNLVTVLTNVQSKVSSLENYLIVKATHKEVGGHIHLYLETSSRLDFRNASFFDIKSGIEKKEIVYKCNISKVGASRAERKRVICYLLTQAEEKLTNFDLGEFLCVSENKLPDYTVLLSEGKQEEKQEGKVLPELVNPSNLVVREDILTLPKKQTLVDENENEEIIEDSKRLAKRKEELQENPARFFERTQKLIKEFYNILSYEAKCKQLGKELTQRRLFIKRELELELGLEDDPLILEKARTENFSVSSVSKEEITTLVDFVDTSPYAEDPTKLGTTEQISNNLDMLRETLEKSKQKQIERQ